MKPEKIRAHLRKQPFQPFRIFLSDGSSHDVRHPELMLVTRSEVIIGLGGGNGDVPDDSVYCDPMHVSRIEPLGNSE